MAEQSFPFTGSNSGEAEWRRMARLWAPSGLAGTPGSVEALIEVGTGNQLVRRAFPSGAWVDGHFARDDADKVLTVEENLASWPRMDWAVMHLAPEFNRITTEIVTGTPAPNPQPPSLSFDPSGLWDLALSCYRMPPAGQPQNPYDAVDARTWLQQHYIERDRWYGTGAPINPSKAFVDTPASGPPVQFYAPPGRTFTVEVLGKTIIEERAEQVIAANAVVTGATGGLDNSNELVNRRYPVPAADRHEPPTYYKGVYTATGGMITVAPRWAAGLGRTRVIIRGCQIIVTL